MTTVQNSKKIIEKEVFSNLKVNRETQKPKFKLGQLDRTADIERVFSKGYSTNWSYESYKTNEKLHMIQSLAIEITIYPRDIIKIYH